VSDEQRVRFERNSQNYSFRKFLPQASSDHWTNLARAGWVRSRQFGFRPVLRWAGWRSSPFPAQPSNSGVVRESERPTLLDHPLCIWDGYRVSEHNRGLEPQLFRSSESSGLHVIRW